MVKKGLIFDIKEFALHDGPGIRTTVFLKGCPLSCLWCHNPEGLLMKPELLITKEGCTHCGHCYKPCRHPECREYGRCIKVCPKDLIKVAGQWMSPAELEEAVRKNEKIMKQMGGVTFSGGEPLLQYEFLEEMIRLLSDFHLVIETSGYAGPDVFERIMQKINLVYLDIKHLDAGLHKKVTGVSNDPIRNNLLWLKKQEIPFIVRVPLIPGINDDKNHLVQIAEILKDSRSLIGVEFMPYNFFAPVKYSKLGRPFLYEGFRGEQSINIPADIFNEYGIPIKVMRIN